MTMQPVLKSDETWEVVVGLHKQIYLKKDNFI